MRCRESRLGCGHGSYIQEEWNPQSMDGRHMGNLRNNSEMWIIVLVEEVRVSLEEHSRSM